jgi:hypothetical protein
MRFIYGRMPFSRRQLLASAGAFISGGIAVGFATQESSAQLDTSIQGLSVPDKSIKTNTGIKRLRLKVDANYSYDTTVTPDRLVLRLEAKTRDKWTQIDAVGATIEGNSYTNTIPLAGSLTVLDGLDSMLPDTVGKSNTESIDLRLVLTARHNGKQIGKTKTTDTVELTATKSSASIDLGLGGSGTIETETETPTG